MWLLYETNPASRAYNIEEGFEIRGDLNIEALKNAAFAVLQRHRSLCSIFIAKDGLLLQQTISVQPEQFIVEEAGVVSPRGTFNLERGPPAFFSLEKLNSEHNIIRFHAHHIVTDGWSNTIIWRELAEQYGAFVTSRMLPEKGAQTHYLDYVLWERSHLTEKYLEPQKAYWKNILGDGDKLPVLHLCLDNPRPAVWKEEGDEISCFISAEVLQSIKAVASSNNATLFMALLTVYFTVLHIYTGQTDLLVGTPVAGRGKKQLENVVGFFLKTLVIRVSCSKPENEEVTIRELLRQVCESTKGALANQDVSFDTLVETLNPLRDTSYHPTFQAMFVMDNFIGDSVPHFNRLQVKPLSVPQTTAKVDICLFAKEVEGKLKLSLNFATALFKRKTMEAILSHFCTLASALSSNLDLTLTRAMPTNIVLNPANPEQFPDQCLNNLFEDQVRSSPNATALVVGQESISYRKLNDQADAIASHVCNTLHVHPGSIVAVLLPRNAFLIPAVLAVFKMGGIYLPIDPLHPSDRVKQMTEGLDISCVLSTTSLVTTYEISPSKVICVDQIDITQSSHFAPRFVHPSSVGYILFTSGSTGTIVLIIIMCFSFLTVVQASQRASESGILELLMS